jgi:hypothetical protein
MASFRGALEMKADIFGVKDEQCSHTFTNAEGTKRIMLGKYVTDAYRDTVEDGIAIIKEVIGSLAKDKEMNGIFSRIEENTKISADCLKTIREFAGKWDSEGIKVI